MDIRLCVYNGRENIRKGERRRGEVEKISVVVGDFLTYVSCYKRLFLFVFIYVFLCVVS